MNFSLKEIINSTMILFSVIDIFGSIPVIIELRRKAGHIQSAKASIAALGIMLVFLFIGESILGLIGIDISSFAVAGAFILFILALEMILGISLMKDVAPETASIVPIAFPLLAGAGTLTTLISIRTEYAVENIVVGIFLNMGLVYLVLKNTVRIEKVLGKNGLMIIRKIFGIVLLALAIKLFTSNWNGLF